MIMVWREWENNEREQRERAKTSWSRNIFTVNFKVNRIHRLKDFVSSFFYFMKRRKKFDEKRNILWPFWVECKILPLYKQIALNIGPHRITERTLGWTVLTIHIFFFFFQDEGNYFRIYLIALDSGAKRKTRPGQCWTKRL